MKINKYIITMIRFNISDFVVVGCYDARPIGSLSSFTQTKHRIVVVFVFLHILLTIFIRFQIH